MFGFACRRQGIFPKQKHPKRHVSFLETTQLQGVKEEV